MKKLSEPTVQTAVVREHIATPIFTHWLLIWVMRITSTVSGNSLITGTQSKQFVRVVRNELGREIVCGLLEFGYWPTRRFTFIRGLGWTYTRDTSRIIWILFLRGQWRKPQPIRGLPTMNEKEIITLLDKALVNISSRELVASSEMQDLLLDIRLHLMTTESASVSQ